MTIFRCDDAWVKLMRTMGQMATPGAHAPAPTSPLGGAIATDVVRALAGRCGVDLATSLTALPRSGLALAPLIFALASPAHAQSFTTPSGLPAEVAEVVLEDDTRFARFRFIAETLGQEGATAADTADDFKWICESFAVPALTAQDWAADQIIISIADRDVPFGTMDAEATQYFAGFTTDGTTCTEELF